MTKIIPALIVSQTACYEGDSWVERKCLKTFGADGASFEIRQFKGLPADC